MRSNFKAETTDVDSVQTNHKFNIGRGRQQKMQVRTYDKSSYHAQPGNQTGSLCKGHYAKVCMWCGRTPAHSKNQCPARDVACNQCQKKGHYAKVCRSGVLNEVNTAESDEEGIAFLGTVSSEGEPWLINLNVNEHTAVFKIDTGADVTVLSEDEFKRRQFPVLESAKRVLQGPGQTPITVRGKFTATIGTDSKNTTQEVYVVPAG